MKIAVQGLGRMGMQIVRKLAEDGHTVIAHNRSHEPIEEAAGYGAIAAYSKEEVVTHFESEPVILWVMLPAEVVDDQVDEWLTLLPKNSVIIDGGNSDYRLTKQLNERLVAAGVRFVDVGTSGGVWGYQNGFCMMAGSDDTTAFEAVEPALKTLAAPEGAYHYFGPSGAGHFVKMTHNAIEYGIMESLAEGYRFLKDGPYQDIDLAAAGEVWQHHSVITSWLNELTRDALKENPSLEGISGYVAESGEARWTLESAREHQIAMPAIQAAFDVRLASQQGDTTFATQLLAAMRNKFGGHNLNKEGRE
ncbi:MAG TPA: decarboxylating 6-phosphogluconate dehydrogenase [Candidatus Saccharimonadales bacterium]|nr:decarboxylating 6-phosphogluconate dehydrogenase [Candidatus Saccharimonadales bacterium]